MTVRALSRSLSIVASASLLACTGTPPPPPPATVRIAMENLAFAPPEVTARVGDTIEFSNKDLFDHTGTAQGGAWNVVLPPGKSGTVMVRSAGTVDYYCTLHPTMKGKIVVK